MSSSTLGSAAAGSSVALVRPAAAPRARAAWGRPAGMAPYMLFLLVPIYWLVNISFKTNADILAR